MAFQVSPGINFTEKDLTTVVPNVSTNIGAFVGAFQWGPISYRTTITTENDLVDLFGKPTPATATHFWSAANYLAYSNNLVVVGVKGAGCLNAAVGDSDAGTAIKVDNPDHYDSLTYTDQLFIAKYPGVRGNSLKVQAIDSNGWADSTVNTEFLANFDNAPGTSDDAAYANGWDGVSAKPTIEDEMHVLVIDEDGLFAGVAGEVLERWAYVSKASDAKRIDGSSNYVVDVMRNESKYAYVGLVTQFTTNTTGSEKAAGNPKAGGAFLTFNSATASESVPGGSLTDGNDGAAMTAAPIQAGWTYFNTPETSDVTLLIGGPGGTTTDTTVAGTVIGVAKGRKDCIAFVSPPQDTVVHATAQAAGCVTAKTGINASNSYGVMDSSWKYQYDRYRDVFFYCPMNGDIAGLCARLDFTHDAWWSPAGINRGAIKNIVKLSWEPTKADRDTMYKAGINALVTQTGAGVILWGDRTMQPTPTAFDRINVRRLFIVLEKAISNAAKSMLFEFNDEFTRAQFVNMVEPFLREIQGRRGITDFKVVCDGSNNTGQIIDTNQFVGDIYVKPTRSINYIQLNFIAARTDVNFTEIGG